MCVFVPFFGFRWRNISIFLSGTFSLFSVYGFFFSLSRSEIERNTVGISARTHYVFHSFIHFWSFPSYPFLVFRYWISFGLIFPQCVCVCGLCVRADSECVVYVMFCTSPKKSTKLIRCVCQWLWRPKIMYADKFDNALVAIVANVAHSVCVCVRQQIHSSRFGSSYSVSVFIIYILL